MSDKRTLGQYLADIITEFSGSWLFVIIFCSVCVAWMLLNSLGIWKFDAYPFLCFNLAMTLISTLQGPVILMSQNRQNDNDNERIRDIISRLDKLQKDMDNLK
jgi:uncharacterized membrane protein